MKVTVTIYDTEQGGVTVDVSPNPTDPLLMRTPAVKLAARIEAFLAGLDFNNTLRTEIGDEPTGPLPFGLHKE